MKQDMASRLALVWVAMLVACSSTNTTGAGTTDTAVSAGEAGALDVSVSGSDASGIDGIRQDIDGIPAGSPDSEQEAGGPRQGSGGATTGTGGSDGRADAISGTGGTGYGSGGSAIDATIQGNGDAAQGRGGSIQLGTGGVVQPSGGSVSANGGAVPGSGGISGTGGAKPGSGGISGTGGAVPGTGGSVSATGGAVPGTGGAVPGTGGAVPGTGGAVPGTGGAVPGTGGAAPGTGGGGGNSAVSARFLHHSTGEVIWGGGVASWLATYNSQHSTNYAVSETYFPKSSPYGWNNYPYDYWNIWVNHAGSSPYMDEPTLEMLTQQYKLIIWKHCFPVSDIEGDSGPDITSSRKSLENYKLQYAALKQKMHQFSSNLFLVWTGAALRESETTSAKATRAQDFARWVTQVWDEPGDNIFIWDFRALETGGGLYLLPANAQTDSHPNSTFGAQVAPFLGKRIVDVIEGRGDTGSITGQ